VAIEEKCVDVAAIISLFCALDREYSGLTFVARGVVKTGGGGNRRHRGAFLAPFITTFRSLRSSTL